MLSVAEREYSLFCSRALFITSATTYVTPVIAIDGQPVGTGQPGPVAQRLRAAYLAA